MHPAVWSNVCRTSLPNENTVAADEGGDGGEE
jgi:hypothetical protein